MSTRQNLIFVMLTLGFCAGVVSAQEMVTDGKLAVRSIASKQGVVGFDVLVDGKLVAPVRFGPNASIVAGSVKKEGNSILFENLSAREGGLKLGTGSFVKVGIKPGHPYPEVSFRIKIEKFDRDAWTSIFGKSPFHFFLLFQDGAEVVHHRGWLVATPVLDPYPLQIAPQNLVCSGWSRDWMWAPPFGACPIPVAGLWTPKNKLYASFDFTKARLTDHSDKYIASSYCWQLGNDKNFVCLVYPFAKNFVKKLRYPSEGDEITSFFEILYHTGMNYWDDPNTFYQEYIWKQYKHLLPASPVVNDLSYLPGSEQLKSFPVPPGIGLTYKVPKEDKWESMFFEEGTIISHSVVYTLFQVDYFYKMNVKSRIEKLKKDLEYFEQKAKKFTINGEECIYWEKPIEGKSKKHFGDVTTLRNVWGWSIGQIMLDIYKYEKIEKYLNYAEGVLNWTKYNICTRNDISDVPMAMFTMGGNGIGFLLDYYYFFRDDPAKKERAKFALEMARRLGYRYLTIFPSDTDEEDNIEGNFLIEPNSAQPWTGQACSNECCAIPVWLLQIYVSTGDPIIKHYVLGMIERWSLLYQDLYADSIKKYPPKFTEAYGLFDECQLVKRGERAKFGSIGGFNDWVFPIGQSKARVVAGEKGAIIFNKEGMHTEISEFRSSKNLEEGLSFKINSKLTEPFDLVVSIPFFDLREKEVIIKRAGVVKKLEKDTDYNVQTRNFWSIYVGGVKNGDIVAVGKLNEKLKVIDCSAVKPLSMKSRSFESEGFKVIDIARYCNEAVNFNWDDSTSYAPVFAGEHYAYKVPYFIVPAYLNNGKPCVVKGEIPLDATTGQIFFFVSEIKDGSKLTINYSDGEKEQVSFTNPIPALQGWPPLFKCRIDMVAHKCKNKTIKSVSADALYLWAVSYSLPEGEAKYAALIKRIEEKKKEEQALAALQEQRKENLKTGYALCLKTDYSADNSYEYTYMYVTDNEVTIPRDSFLEYDIFIPKDSVGINGGVDLTGGTVGNIRDRVGAHPAAKIEESQKGQWVHRRYDIGALEGMTFQYAVIGVDGKEHKKGTYRAYYKNILVTDEKGKILFKLYEGENKIPSGEAGIASNGGVKEMTNYSVSVVPASEIK